VRARAERGHASDAHDAAPKNAAQVKGHAVTALNPACLSTSVDFAMSFVGYGYRMVHSAAAQRAIDFPVR